MVMRGATKFMRPSSGKTRIWGLLGLCFCSGLALAAGPYPNGQPGFMEMPAGNWQFPPARQQPQSIGISPQGFSFGPSQNGGARPQPMQRPAGPGGGPAPGYGYGYGYPNGAPMGRSQPAPSYSQPQARSGGGAPRIEEQLSDSRPYAQETVIYSVRIVSEDNLEQVDIELPKSDAAVFKKLDGPNARARMRGGRREIVNEFRYALTPLHAGKIELSPIQISGTKTAAGYGRGAQAFEVTGKQRVRLDVKPAVPGVRPWLPLQHLTLRTELLGAEEPAPGKPFTLMVQMNAVGASGSQLPSLEQQLQSADFRVYREQTQADGGLSSDGRRLEGVRKEFYTLVPQHGGELKLPPLRLAWWNVSSETMQYASVPTRPLKSSGGLFGGYSLRMPDGTFFLAGSSSVFWVPLAAVFGLLAGYWLAIWMRGPRGDEQEPSPLAPLWLRLRVFGGALWRLLSPALGRMREPLADAGTRMGPALAEMGRQAGRQLSKLSPMPYWRRLVELLVHALPRSLRFWFCVRSLRHEAEPERWSLSLKGKGCKHLGLSPQVPLSKLGAGLIAHHPSADPARVEQLLRHLDGAIYARHELDFEQWKRSFAHEVRPSLLPRRRSAKARRGGLPVLNPVRL